MAIYDSAFNYVFDKEKGYVNNPNDSGGPTKYGVSLKLLKSLDSNFLVMLGFSLPITIEDIQALTPGQAKAIFKKVFWDEIQGDSIINQSAATFILDMAVNLGEGQAAKLTQRATWSVNLNWQSVPDDGDFGKVTLGAVNSAGDDLLPALRSERANFYRGLYASDIQDREFFDGWLNRTYEKIP